MDGSAARRTTPAVTALVVVSVVVVVLLGIWVTGGVLTDDATSAKVLTGCWFGASGLVALLLARTWPGLAVAAVGSWPVAVPSTSAGGTADGSAPSTPASGPRLEATGRFRSGEHETRGRATLLRTPDGRRILTLTGFATAPGPDLRVYLVPRRSGVDDAVDVGGLKGNKGDQQYVVPGSARVASVVVWCRAFSVAFGTAVLRGG
jgi:hypothetical protein